MGLAIAQKEFNVGGDLKMKTEKKKKKIEG